MNNFLSELYFAYGVNMDRSIMQVRCPGAEPFKPAILKGHRIVFVGDTVRWGGAVASIEPHTDTVVLGATYRITAPDLAELDRWEDVPLVYVRRVLTVHTNDGSTFPAHVYVSKLESVGAPPSRGYLLVLYQAYQSWGFPTAALDRFMALAEDRSGTGPKTRP